MFSNKTGLFYNIKKQGNKKNLYNYIFLNEWKVSYLPVINYIAMVMVNKFIFTHNIKKYWGGNLDLDNVNSENI